MFCGTIQLLNSLSHHSFCNTIPSLYYISIVKVLFGEILPMHTASGELVNFGAYCVKRLCENDDISRAYTCKIGTHGAGM